MSVQVQFAYDDFHVRNFAGVNESVDGAMISGDVTVIERFRMLSTDPVFGFFLNDQFNSSNFAIGPFGDGIDPGYDCFPVDGMCIYVQDDIILAADQTYVFDQSSGILDAFLTSTILASLRVDLNLDFETNTDEFRIVASAGYVDPLPDYSLNITYTFADPVPLPPALPLFAGGLGLMGWLARRKRKQAAHP